MNHPSSELPALAILGVLTIIAVAHRSEAQIAYSLQRIPAGTTVVDSEANRWNQLILLARPVLTSGDIDRLPSGLQQSVSRFSYTVMATVSKSSSALAADPSTRGSSAADSREAAKTQAPNFQLAEVGIGYSAPVQGRQVIVTASQNAVSANLGIIDRQVLGQNESDLETFRVVVRSSTLMMFDSHAILARESGHRKEQVRNLVWIDPNSGKSAMAMWLVEQRRDVGQPEDALAVKDEPMQVYPGGTRGNNRLHVDGNTFLLGIPMATTFGLEHLLRGRQIQWNDKLRQLAGRLSYSSETLAKFTAALNDAIQTTQRESAATE